jgi:deoxyadenosine/deoxycytidine kinase
MLVSIEGNIGCGKSTVLDAIGRLGNASSIKFQIEKEPVDQWTLPFGEPLSDGNRCTMLGEYYKNPTTNALAFQMFILHTRLVQYDRIRAMHAAHKDKEGSLVTLVERSMLSEKAIFAKLNISSNPSSWHCYNTWQSAILSDKSKMSALPSLIVYLRCDPAKCMSRILDRGRIQEHSIDLDYIKKIHCAHEDWLQSIATENGPLVLTLDASKDGDDAIDDIVRFIVTTVENIMSCT